MFQSILPNVSPPVKDSTGIRCQLCRRTNENVRYGVHVTGKNASVFIPHCTGPEQAMCADIRAHTCRQCGFEYPTWELVKIETGGVRCVDCLTANYSLHGGLVEAPKAVEANTEAAEAVAP